MSMKIDRYKNRLRIMEYTPASYDHDEGYHEVAKIKLSSSRNSFMADWTLEELESAIQIKNPLPVCKPTVPPYVQELVDYTVSNNIVPADMIAEFYHNNTSTPVDEINVPSTLNVEALSKYFTIASKRFSFERACFQGAQLDGVIDELERALMDNKSLEVREHYVRNALSLLKSLK